jgi:hypothetical protein
MAEAARQILDRYLQGRAAYIEALAGNDEIEALRLDFERLDGRAGRLGVDDKRNLSKALSGFANSDGGSLCGGVDARTGAEAAALLRRRLAPPRCVPGAARARASAAKQPS